MYETKLAGTARHKRIAMVAAIALSLVAIAPSLFAQDARDVSIIGTWSGEGMTATFTASSFEFAYHAKGSAAVIGGMRGIYKQRDDGSYKLLWKEKWNEGKWVLVSSDTMYYVCIFSKDEGDDKTLIMNRSTGEPDGNNSPDQYWLTRGKAK